MNKSEEGIPKVTRKELNLILDRIKEKGINKGIVLMGIPGVGKTTIVKNLIDIQNNKSMQLEQRSDESDYRFRERQSMSERSLLKLISTNSICSQFMLGGFEKVQHTSIYALDDLGTEIIPSHFGTSIDLVPHLIQLGYEQNVNFGYYTTNLNYNELAERYGARVIDRLQEKCYFFILEDTPFRKLATAEKINQELNEKT